MTASDGSVVRLRDRLGHGLLVVLVAPGTTVWDRRHWQSAGLMPRLTSVVAALPMPAEVLVAESYPGAAAHTVLVVRPDGHLVTALSGVRPVELAACAEAVRGGALGRGGGAARRTATAGDPGTAGPSPVSEAPGAPGAADSPSASESSEAEGGGSPVDPVGSSMLHSESD